MKCIRRKRAGSNDVVKTDMTEEISRAREPILASYSQAALCVAPVREMMPWNSLRSYHMLLVSHISGCLVDSSIGTYTCQQHIYLFVS